MNSSWSKPRNTKNSSPRSVYLNNAFTSFPKAPGLGEEVKRWLEEVPIHPERSAGKNGTDSLSACRQEIARLVHLAESERVVLCKNATEALNIAFLGLDLPAGACVVTSAAEHNSVLRPLFRLKKRGAIRLHIVPCDHQGRVDERGWQEAVSTLSPKLSVLIHASNVSGAVNGPLLHEARKYGSLTLLDASQTIGVLDVDMEREGADIVAFTGHKFLLGPEGTGGLCVRPGLELIPVFVGGTGVRSDLPEMPPEMPLRLEAGTPALALFAGLHYALSWLRERALAHDFFQRKAHTLEAALQAEGARVIGVTAPRTGVVSFTLPNMEAGEAGFILERVFGIHCRSGLHCAPLIHESLGALPHGTVRFSISRFTSEEEIAYAASCVGKIIRETHTN